MCQRTIKGTAGVIAPSAEQRCADFTDTNHILCLYCIYSPIMKLALGTYHQGMFGSTGTFGTTKNPTKQNPLKPPQIMLTTLTTSESSGAWGGL